MKTKEERSVQLPKNASELQNVSNKLFQIKGGMTLGLYSYDQPK